MARATAPSRRDHRSDYMTWAKTEFKNDWQFAYQHMLDHNGAAPRKGDIHNQNTNLQGWV